MARALYADLGRTDYARTLELQRHLSAMRHEDRIPDVILFTEHNPAILFGRKKTSFSHEAISAAQVQEKHPQKHAEDMGLAVHHQMPYDSAAYVGPGQIAVYPVMDYTRLFAPRDAAGYKTAMDRIIVELLGNFGIASNIRKDVCVDVEGGFSKIASKGVRLGPKVASHGFHLHVTNEGTKHFGMISIPGHGPGEIGFTSMESVMGYKPLHEDVIGNTLSAIKKHLNYDRIEQCIVQQTDDGVSVKKL